MSLAERGKDKNKNLAVENVINTVRKWKQIRPGEKLKQHRNVCFTFTKYVCVYIGFCLRTVNSNQKYTVLYIVQGGANHSD